MAREAERDAQRRDRARQKYLRELEKLEALERAQYEVKEYEQYMDEIVSLHRQCNLPFEWQDFIVDIPPQKPEKLTAREDAARLELEHYIPSFFANLFGGAEKQKSALRKKIEEAIAQDKNEYEEKVEEYNDWVETHALAVRVLDGEPEAYIEAVKRINPFSDIMNLGSYVEVSSSPEGVVSVSLKVHGEDIVPKEIKSLLKSGKASSKQMPITKFYEYYQDYVCSCVLRLGREIFALLPINETRVTAMDKILNRATGHIEEQPILSVRMPRQTCEQLNFSAIDPSDSMRNFVHNMDFKKSQGFSAVSTLNE